MTLPNNMRVEDWLLAAIHDVVIAVKEGALTHTGASRRREVVDMLGENHPFIDYIIHHDEEQIVGDINYALQSVGRVAKIDQDNSFLKTFANFLITDIAVHIDNPTVALTYTKSKLGKAVSLRHISYHQITRSCVDFLTQTGLAKVEYVQTPVVLSAEERAEMRARLPEVFVVFLTDQSLLGGIRRVAQGNIIDNSWLGRVQRFVQHTKA